MITVTSVPVGSTGLLLEGTQVGAAIRESVVLSDPETADGFAKVVSTQPTAEYGLPVWIQGTPSVGISGTASTQIVSSIPFYVAQSSAPWTVNGGMAVTNVPTVNVTNVPLVTVQGTSSVNVISSAPHAIVGTVSTQIISSIPFFVAQSSGPWDMRGGVSVTNSPNVNVTNVPAVNITSSVPFYVAQSSAPWFFVETVSTNAGVNSTSLVLIATLNTTVVKAGKANLYGYDVSNFASTSLFIKLANASSAVIASTAAILYRIGVAPSSNAFVSFDMGVTFSTGITMFTTRNPWAADLTAPLGSTATVTLTYF